jgi:hypothetical protein
MTARGVKTNGLEINLTLFNVAHFFKKIMFFYLDGAAFNYLLVDDFMQTIYLIYFQCVCIKSLVLRFNVVS